MIRIALTPIESIGEKNEKPNKIIDIIRAAKEEIVDSDSLTPFLPLIT